MRDEYPIYKVIYELLPDRSLHYGEVSAKSGRKAAEILREEIEREAREEKRDINSSARNPLTLVCG